jgi:hypothetical protein
LKAWIIGSLKAMKAFLLLAVVLTARSSVFAEATTMQNFSPHLSAKAQIVWNAPTNTLPNNLWVYRRHGPRIFSASVISNAIVLGSLQNKGIPRPPLKDFFIWDDRGPNYPGPIPSIFYIRPGWATIGYSIPHPDRGRGTDIPSDSVIIRRAWGKLPRFGIDPKQVKFKNLTSSYCRYDETGRDVTNHLCGRGVFLSRQIDGISFYGTGDNGDSEGFWIDFGSREQVRAFTLNWPNLDRHKLEQTATPERIMECFRKQKVVVMPQPGENDYFERIKRLSIAQKFLITKVTPHYGEGQFGEMPTDKGTGDVPTEFIAPFAEMEITADFGSNKATAIAVSPVLSSDTVRLLKDNRK